MSASTATATTVTASPGAPAYIGRFAPSPTGALHLGSLVAALGSYLDARHHGGQWLLRIDDLDTPRVIPGCAETLLHTLEAFGLTWDGEVTWQSLHLERYRAALESLRSSGLTFECSCSRRMRLESDERGYPGTCRDKPPTTTAPTATRLRIDDEAVTIEDRFQGRCEISGASMGDVVVRRRDGLYAYQLAVVVDDALQGITHVVRGADLLDSTGWQVCLQRALNVMSPAYAHLPLIVEPDGSKLAKSRRSIALDPTRATSLLITALGLLGQPIPPGLDLESPGTVLGWSIEHWNPRVFFGTRAIPAPAG